MGRWLLLLAWTWAGCGQVERVRIIDQVQETGAFSTLDVTLDTLDDIDRVRGAAGQVYAGAIIDVDEAVATTTDGVGGVRDGAEVDARWIRDGDVAVAVDFDTLLMFTAYAHLERAVRYYEALGVTPAATAPIDIYYLPVLDGAETYGVPTHDNALFFTYSDAMLILPAQILQDIPLGMNLGVIAHEYGHRVFYYEGWGRMIEIIKRYDGRFGEVLSSFHLLSAVDEGVADYHGAVVMGDPAFVGHSVAQVGDERDLRGVHVFDPAWLDGTTPLTSSGAYDPHIPGSVLSSALWRTGEAIGHDQTGAAILAAARTLAPKLAVELSYTVGELEAAFIEALPEVSRDVACDIFAEGYAEVWSTVGICP